MQRCRLAHSKRPSGDLPSSFNTYISIHGIWPEVLCFTSRTLCCLPETLLVLQYFVCLGRALHTDSVASNVAKFRIESRMHFCLCAAGACGCCWHWHYCPAQQAAALREPPTGCRPPYSTNWTWLHQRQPQQLQGCQEQQMQSAALVCHRQQQQQLLPIAMQAALASDRTSAASMPAAIGG